MEKGEECLRVHCVKASSMKKELLDENDDQDNNDHDGIDDAHIKVQVKIV